MKFKNSAIILVAIIIFSVFPSYAQESEAVVIDEVVAQVNEGVITLSRVKREMKEAADALIQQGSDPEKAKTEIQNRQGELIASLINEELLIQKAKEIGLDSEIEAQINQRFLQIMKEQNIKSLEALKEEMRKGGFDPDVLRENWRKEMIQGSVLQREVDGKIYWGLSNKEMKDYYDKNKAKFTKPETVTLSEIFLSFAGRDKAEVLEKAKKLVAQLRGGADFVKLALENSDRPNVKDTNGKLQTFKVAELNDIFQKPLKNLKVGNVTDPIEIDEGLEILRVDDRTAASSESQFDEDEVRRAILMERAPAERKKFMANLRKDSYIKISEGYRALVSPILFEDERKAEVKKPAK